MVYTLQALRHVILREGLLKPVVAGVHGSANNAKRGGYVTMTGLYSNQYQAGNAKQRWSRSPPVSRGAVQANQTHAWAPSYSRATSCGDVAAFNDSKCRRTLTQHQWSRVHSSPAQNDPHAMRSCNSAGLQWLLLKSVCCKVSQ